MTPRRVLIDDPVVLSLGRYLDDPDGLRAVLAAIDALADDPRPPGSVPWGSTLARLHTGRYRVLYEITEDAVLVRHVARLPATN